MATNEAVSKLYCAVIEWSAGGRGQPVVDAAVDALVDGLDTPGLRYLAGATRASADADAAEWVPKVAEELDLPVPDRLSPEAHIRLGRLLSERFLRDRTDPSQFARTMYRLYIDSGYSAELVAFTGLDDWYDLLQAGVVGGDAQDIDEATVVAAQDLVAGLLADAVPLGDYFLLDDSGQVTRTWVSSQQALQGRESVPAAGANGHLLASMPVGWHRRVVTRTSMHDLLFTRPGDRHPFKSQVRVSWRENVCSFTLSNEVGVVASDRCFTANAPAVLAAFLCQLVGGEPE